MRMSCSIVIGLFVVTAAARAAETDSLESIAQRIAEQIAAKPEIPRKLYAAPFLEAVPVEQLATICKAIFEKQGKVLHVGRQSGTSATSGKFTFRCQDAEMTVSLSIDSAEPHQVVGLWFGPASPRIRSWDEITARLAKLPGQVSFQVERLDDGKVLASHQPDKSLGIGSAFKLYLLATLVEQKVAWDKIVTVEERYKSLPSGQVQNWPAGSPATVHTLAVQMISLSDNSATDHLLALAGREEVEKRLESFGLKDPAADIPFLATREFFRLKADAPLRKEFLAAKPDGRKKVLERMAGLPRMKDEDEEWSGPLAIDRIEWFASSADICRVLAWLDKHGGPTAQAILAVNSGGIFPSEKFSYVGFKAGSESGVLSLNWLLHAGDGKRYSLSAIWNNPAKEVDRGDLAGVLSAAANLLAEPTKKN
jgi:beta-lactamase class A